MFTRLFTDETKTLYGIAFTPAPHFTNANFSNIKFKNKISLAFKYYSQPSLIYYSLDFPSELLASI